MRNKFLIISIFLVLSTTLIVGCDLGNDTSIEDSESKGEVKMTSGTQKTDSDEGNNILIDNKDDVVDVVDVEDVQDDDGTVFDDEIEENGGPGDREGMFGNLPYTDGAIIEYYMGNPSDGKPYNFTSMYGLHVEDNKIVAIEDIIFVNLVNPETMTKEEKKQIIQKVYQQMEESNFSRADGLEIIAAHNEYGDEMAVSFVYYVFDPLYASFEDYNMYKSYFDAKGFIHINAGYN